MLKNLVLKENRMTKETEEKFPKRRLQIDLGQNTFAEQLSGHRLI